jgi:AcrR family transcriptional regulator
MANAEEPARSGRADARRNERSLLEAAARVFVAHGVDAPVRLVAAEAGVGMGTVYRHFPTRSELVVAVFRHQVDALADAGPALLELGPDPAEALHGWVAQYVDFLVTKHGLARALGSDLDAADALHRMFIERLAPVCDALLAAALPAPPIAGIALMRGVGNLCAGGRSDPAYDPRHMAALLVRGVLGSSDGSEGTRPGGGDPRASNS